jgi:hypothetical protein
MEPHSDNRPLRFRLRSLLGTAVRQGSIPHLQSALEMVQTEAPEDAPNFITQALHKAIQEYSLPVIEHLLEQEDVDVSALSNMEISVHLQIPLLKLLIAHGRNINQQDSRDSDSEKGRRLIDWACHDEEVVQWLLENGAHVDGGEEEFEGLEPRPAPLLETCVAVGSLASFTLLQSHGAKLGRRTLHRAAEAGAMIGADPANVIVGIESEDTDEMRKKRNIEEILRHLVDELGLGVNAMDTDTPRGWLHYGTPINYAARHAKGVKTVEWLLSKGADPRIQSLDESHMDAEAYARTYGCEETLEILKQISFPTKLDED